MYSPIVKLIPKPRSTKNLPAQKYVRIFTTLGLAAVAGFLSIPYFLQGKVKLFQVTNDDFKEIGKQPDPVYAHIVNRLNKGALEEFRQKQEDGKLGGNQAAEDLIVPEAPKQLRS